jgi:hypothetical protein
MIQIRAKSIFQRDRARLQQRKMAPIKPEPVEAQTKEPMVIDLDSSPQELKKEPSAEPSEPSKENRTMAPFPDMGMDISVPESKPDLESAMPDSSDTVQNHGVADNDFTAPVPVMDQGDSAQQMDTSGTGDVSAEAPASDLNFTTMQFSLAPANEGQQGDSSGPDVFDLTGFDSAPGTQDDVSLSLVPDNNNNQTQGEATVSQDATSGTQNHANNTTAEMTDEALNNLLDMDFGGDPNDFDFGLEGDSFNDLMTSHEGNFDTAMEHGQFDDEFFGLDNNKTEGT